MLALFAATSVAAEDKIMNELAPTGTLRVGVAYAPLPTPVFVAKDSSGDYRGVPRDIGTALSKALGVPVEVIVKATTGELTEACASGAIDVGFMPIDDERKQKLDFSPPYFVIESTYLVVADRPEIKTLTDIDRSDVTVVGINGSTTIRAATRSLKTAKAAAAKSVDEAMAMLKDGRAQAFALTHDSLPRLQVQLPGSRILDGAFQTTGVGIAMQKNKPEGLAALTKFVSEAKANGIVRNAFDEAGLKGLSIAP
jgi:polar amino acid transport system substrate-binding protein